MKLTIKKEIDMELNVPVDDANDVRNIIDFIRDNKLSLVGTTVDPSWGSINNYSGYKQGGSNTAPINVITLIHEDTRNKTFTIKIEWKKTDTAILIYKTFNVDDWVTY